ncbi:unnamed protein product [Cuscuta europaea]|uniref:Uncharacterized protein n=1 Tax=Cuscuta europaea TaxID=41803 RepID=A0A9P1ECR3_CUSEU|nr:unnamed protein product [Cuscuta europaea]
MRTHCVHLSTVLEWTRQTFDLLHKVLERNSGALLTQEESDLAADLKARDLEIARLLLSNCVLDSFPDEIDHLKCEISVADQIDRGLYYYKRAKFWEDASPHLKRMQDIERDMVKKSVEEDHKQLDHLFFQKCIKEQIEVRTSLFHLPMA